MTVKNSVMDVRRIGNGFVFPEESHNLFLHAETVAALCLCRGKAIGFQRSFFTVRVSSCKLYHFPSWKNIFPLHPYTKAKSDITP